jgi:hypothetical protein
MFPINRLYFLVALPDAPGLCPILVYLVLEQNIVKSLQVTSCVVDTQFSFCFALSEG